MFCLINFVIAANSDDQLDYMHTVDNIKRQTLMSSYHTVLLQYILLTSQIGHSDNILSIIKISISKGSVLV